MLKVQVLLQFAELKSSMFLSRQLCEAISTPGAQDGLQPIGYPEQSNEDTQRNAGPP